MKLYNYSINKILLFIFSLSTLSSQTYWVKYGWEMVLLAAELLRADSPIKYPKQFSDEYH